MRLGRIAVGGVICLAPTLVCGCVYIEPQPTARFEITELQQNYYEFLEEYGMVYVYYRVTNTGPVDIDYYEVWIEVQCEGGYTYQDWTNGLNLARGSYLTDYDIIDTAGHRATSATVTNYKLTSY